MKKYIVHHHAVKKPGAFTPISDLQLAALAEKTRLELELKSNQTNKNLLSDGEASEVIIKCL